MPTDVRAIYAIELSLDLLSGQRSSWKRANVAFLKALRQQFLVWRTLTPGMMDNYRAKGGDSDARERLAKADHRPIVTSVDLRTAAPDADLSDLPPHSAAGAIDRAPSP